MTVRLLFPRRLFEGHESSVARSDSDSSVEDGMAVANESSSSASELGLPASTSSATLQSPLPCKDGKTEERCPTPPHPCTCHAPAPSLASLEGTISYGFPRKRQHVLQCRGQPRCNASAQAPGNDSIILQAEYEGGGGGPALRQRLTLK